MSVIYPYASLTMHPLPTTKGGIWNERVCEIWVWTLTCWEHRRGGFHERVQLKSRAIPVIFCFPFLNNSLVKVPIQNVIFRQSAFLQNVTLVVVLRRLMIVYTRSKNMFHTSAENPFITESGSVHWRQEASRSRRCTKQSVVINSSDMPHLQYPSQHLIKPACGFGACSNHWDLIDVIGVVLQMQSAIDPHTPLPTQQDMSQTPRDGDGEEWWGGGLISNLLFSHMGIMT